MNIPTFDKDLSIIQKLSDLPNDMDGLSADELKGKFDEAGLEIQKWLNNIFIPALKAENIPFTASEQLNADNVQDAIRFVFGQISDASSGTIANGSVTKEKLAAALIARVFGGRPWVSLDKPKTENNPASDFPVGQIWLKPGFSVVNAAGKNWTNTGCTTVTQNNETVVTGNGTVVQTDAVMNLSGIGQDGDRVYILFNIKDRDPEISSLTVSFNGGEEESSGKNSHEATLSGGALSIRFRTVWPSTSLAVGSYTIENLAVVNIDQILRQVDDCKEMEDWSGYLYSLLPLGSFYDPRAMYIQTASGIWRQFDYETTPVEKGGTGNSEALYGEMLYGTGTARMERLAAAEVEGSILQFVSGKPQWSEPVEAAEKAGLARTAESTYKGTGTAGSVQLPGKPAVLWLRTDEQTYQLFQKTTVSKEYDGNAGQAGQTGGIYPYKYTAGVTLDGNVLNFWKQLPDLPSGQEWREGDAVYLNEKDKTYTWTAIY